MVVLDIKKNTGERSGRKVEVYRINEVGVSSVIYFAGTTFFAACDCGKAVVRDGSLEGIREKLDKAVPLAFRVKWEGYILVETMEPFAEHADGRWDITDPETWEHAPPFVGFKFSRTELGRKEDGSWAQRMHEADRGEYPDSFAIWHDFYAPHGWDPLAAPSQTYGKVRRYLPYSSETWEALKGLQRKIRKLAHALSFILTRDAENSAAYVMRAANSHLLTVNEDSRSE